MRRPLITLAFTLIWGGYLLSPIFARYLPFDVAFVVSTGLLLGYLVREWWAMTAPLAAVTVLLLPVAYTGGAADYSVGYVVAVGFSLVAVPSVLVAVAIARRRDGSRP